MSRRAYPVADRYEEIERDYYRDPLPRPRSSAPHEEIDIDIDIDRRSRAPPPRTEYATTEVRERERTRNVPDFLREDYARSTAGPLVVREEFVERDRSRQRPRERSEVEREEIKITERERSDVRSRRGDDARSEIRSIAPSRRGEVREEEIIETKSRATEREEWTPKRNRDRDREIDISIRERKDEDVRSRRGSPPRTVREGEREEITFRRGEVERRPPRVREREVEKEEVVFRREESIRPSPPRSRARSVGREREIDIDIKQRDISDSHSRGPRESVEKEEIIFRPRERGSPPPRERSMPPPPQLIGREREEIIYRRRPEPPPPPREVEKEKIVIRQQRRSSPSPAPPPAPPPPPREERESEQIIIRQRRQRTPSPSPSPSPPPPPPIRSPEPIIQPPIKQEIIREIVTHHRHIDHGVERARSPSPPPAPEPPAPKKEERKEEDLEIEIRRRGTRDGKHYDEDIIFEDRRRDTASRARSESLDTHRPRSASPARTERSERRVVREERDDNALEADYYNRKIAERAYMGEAWNGATKDWGLVDVPPGTRRVAMEGIGGGSQEITWQKYNGVRRGKFITGDQEYDAEFETGRRSLPPPEPEKPREEIRETRIDIRERESPRGGGELVRREEVFKPAPPKDMWTEITKDLVIKEAIEEMGYDYEETDPFFYVMEYLKYDDVLRLVELSEHIRHQRRDRIREIQWEREEVKDRDRVEVEHRSRHEPRYEDVIYEREVYEETAPRRHRYRY